MSNDVNVVVLSGRLTRDAELRQTPSGTPVLGFGLASSLYRKGADGSDQERTAFTDCQIYGKRAEGLAGILAKGMQVTVSGRLEYETWEKDGQRRSKHSVTVSDIVLPPRHSDSRQPEIGAQNQFGGSTGAYSAPAVNYQNVQQAPPAFQNQINQMFQQPAPQGGYADDPILF